MTDTDTLKARIKAGGGEGWHPQCASQAVDLFNDALNFWSDMFTVIKCETDPQSSELYWQGTVSAYVRDYGTDRHKVQFTVEASKDCDEPKFYMSPEGEVTASITSENVWMQMYSTLSENFSLSALQKGAE